LVGRLRKIFGQERDGKHWSCPANAKKQVGVLIEQDGEEIVEKKFNVWLPTASFVGLNQAPIEKFLREYEDIDETVEVPTEQGSNGSVSHLKYADARSATPERLHWQLALPPHMRLLPTKFGATVLQILLLS
jgi:hypothetical protein